MRLYPADWLLTRKALRDDRLGEYFVPLELKSMFRPTSSSGIPIYGRSQTASIQIAFDLTIQYIASTGYDPFFRRPEELHRALFARVEMQIHLMTIARYLRCDTFNRGRLSSKPA